jgi:hypothetical protein
MTDKTPLMQSLDRMGEWKSRYDPDHDDTCVTIYVDDDVKRGTICPIAEVGGQQQDEYDDLDTDTTAARFAILILQAPLLYRECRDAMNRIRELIDKEELPDAAVNWLYSIADNLEDPITDAETPRLL